ncbi:MAG: site-specific tyrosine recombinase XerD [Rikenellaceae bacterium]|nr:site-specific tyrosine recombinase XerD [Rikenellaceae bacterium]
MSETDRLWNDFLEKYRYYIQLEKSLSANTVEAYLRDARRFGEFVRSQYGVRPAEVTERMVEHFMARLYDEGKKKSSQGRTLSGLRSFYNYLTINGDVEEAPTEFIESPQAGRPLPDVLSVEEIDAILATADLSSPLGIRNRALLETLYSCGLRVSEAVNLRLGDLFFDEQIVRVTGKGSKQRLVPMSGEAVRRIRDYLTVRHAKGDCDTLFLNNRGRGLTREMVFILLKQSARKAGIVKHVSPHSFRHSFATHLLQGGADIRQVQELLGHASVTTTEIYTHLNIDSLADSLRAHHPLSKL